MKSNILIFIIFIINFSISNTYSIYNLSDKTLTVDLGGYTHDIKPERCEGEFRAITHRPWDLIIYDKEKTISLALSREHINILSGRGITLYINLKKNEYYIELKYEIHQQTFESSGSKGTGSAHKRISQPGPAIDYNKVSATPGPG